MMNDLFLRRKRKLKVDLSELEEDEKEFLSSFLRSNLNADITSSDNKCFVDSEKVSTQELKRLITKFVYHRNLNLKYWVSLERDTVKINKFKDVKKRERGKKELTPPSTIRHGW